MRSARGARSRPFRGRAQTLQFADTPDPPEGPDRTWGDRTIAAQAELAAPGPGAAHVADTELVDALRAGDDGAFERLYHRYHRQITAYIHGMVKDHGRAEDLTQETFISALRRLRQTDWPIAFRPWIYEIAKNACIDQFRRSRRAEEVPYDGEADMNAADYGRWVTASLEPAAAVDQKLTLDSLRGAFGGLSDIHHEILVLRELEGLSYRQIGERLGMSRAAVESTLFRARKRLADEYGQLLSGERCLRVQAMISQGPAAALRGREGRRLARHISHCTPCRRQARLAGLEVATRERRPLRTRVAAFLPLPLFLRRRADDGGLSSFAASHAPTLAQWSASLGPLGEPASSGWMKATATTAALAIAGAGAGVATDAVHVAVPRRVAPLVSAPARPAAAGPEHRAPTLRQGSVSERADAGRPAGPPEPPSKQLGSLPARGLTEAQPDHAGQPPAETIRPKLRGGGSGPLGGGRPRGARPGRGGGASEHVPGAVGDVTPNGRPEIPSRALPTSLPTVPRLSGETGRGLPAVPGVPSRPSVPPTPVLPPASSGSSAPPLPLPDRGTAGSGPGAPIAGAAGPVRRDAPPGLDRLLGGSRPS